MLIDVIILLVVAFVAYYLITKFLPGTIQTIALVVVGIVLLLWLLQMFGVSNKLIN